MRVTLAYGRHGLEVELPDHADVVEPKDLPGLPDEAAALRRALREPLAGPPLRALVPPGARVGIVICDVTRPMPSWRVLPVLLEELPPSTRVTLFVATGTHRACTPAELEAMLGPELARSLPIVQHDAFDRSRHAYLGVASTGGEAWIEREFLEQDVKVLTGFIEPHFFAGFSGGPKMVCPGLAAIETVLHTHGAAFIAHPNATWGVTHGNPVHDEARAIAALARPDFSLDVTLNKRHEITAVFAGELFAAHAAGCAFAHQTAMAPVDRPYDVVVTTNSGYPLDQNLYQAVKGMSAAAQIVRPGGAIVIASECADGLPEHGRYKDLLREALGPEAFLERLAEPGFQAHDQWQVQVQAQIQRKARVLVKARGLSPEQLRAAWFEPIDDVTRAVEALTCQYGPRVAVLPQGPQTIPYVRAGAFAPA